jgi:hypothetical protein
VAITHKRSRGELAMQDESLSGDEVQEVVPPRGKFLKVILHFAADKTQQNS